LAPKNQAGLKNESSFLSKISWSDDGMLSSRRQRSPRPTISSKEILMNASTRSIRGLAALAAFVSVAALATQAFATISNPAADQRMLVGSDAVAPVVAGVVPASEPKVPVRQAKLTRSCR
jgi:hypothetical protein